ncbi:MAG TPA: glutamine--fructose-6-phosphate transaminase (isomerizing), partial [Nocardioides sp.]|uniref:glutamine--fructose-6-phosphate transaminase (isomerizing) n=1 Tax=Nocardioides sp. TaxID=35761 RepID=UPI002E3780AD
MCGIVGYVGPRQAQDVVLGGLRRLEYRGYDSAGVAVVSDGALAVSKKAGKLANLEKAIADRPLPPSTTGVGHTRWATHGAPNDLNAHPHMAVLNGRDAGRVALVHNGIIENFAELRARIEADDHVMVSETDTEVAAQLLELQLESGIDLTVAMQRVCQQLEGAFTLVAVDALDPTRVVAARRSSPLVVGLGDGENFLGSDVAAFIDYTREALELGQDQVVTITSSGVEVTDFRGVPVEGRRYHVDWDLSAAEKEGHDWFMRKEIFEQPRAVADSLLGRRTAQGLLQLDEMRLSDQELRDIDKIIIVACGTSFYAGMVAKYAIEHWTRVPVEVELSSEFRYRDPILDYSTLVVAISQSGETADTLQAIRHARTQRSKVLAICNTNGSTIPRESDAVIYTHAGPEIGVASTKGFLTQLVACYLLALYLAQVKGTRFGDEISQVMDQLEEMPGHIETVLGKAEEVYALARDHVDSRSVLFLGRHAGYPVALEGALKLKELAYLHAEGFAAGELKHGPIALIEDGMPVFCVVPPHGRDQLHDKMV